MSGVRSNREDEDDEIQRKDERRHRKRSRSRGRSHRHRNGIERRSRSHSHSRSIDRHRRRGHKHDTQSRTRSRSHSRSKSRSYGNSSRRKSSRRYDRSRSRSRSRSHSRSSRRSPKRSYSSRYSASRSPQRSYDRYENKKSRSRSSERYYVQEPKEEDKTTITRSNSESRKSLDVDNNSSQYFSCTAEMDTLENLPLPETKNTETTEINSNTFIDDSEEPIDKERIHREMEEKLRQALAKEGKIYPPPKPEASHPVFANDGSFLEIFKKMQEAQQNMTSTSVSTASAFGITAPSTSSAAASAAYTVPFASAKPAAPPPPPLVGRRRGGKILKTGLVAKPKVTNTSGDDKDFWSLYLAEVNKYKNNACELNSGNRPLLK